MSDFTCSVEDTSHTSGKLTRGMCAKHYQRWRKYGTAQGPEARDVICSVCSATFTTNNSHRKYCSEKCRYRYRDHSRSVRNSVICSICGELMEWGRQLSPNGDNAHNRCRTGTDEDPVHGTYKTYSERGCRCAECMAYHEARRDAFRERWRAEFGVNPSTLYKRQFRAEHGFSPPRSRDDVPLANRRAVYERDDWVCQICCRDIPWGGHDEPRLLASVDHIEPQALTLVPDHSVSNLRMAHMICNAVRGNGRLSDDRVRALDPAFPFLEILGGVAV